MNVAWSILATGADASVAVLHKDNALTYRDLRKNVAQLADDLLTCGHVKGDRIGLWSENSPAFVIAYLGIIQAGLVVVPFQTELDEQGFASIVRDVGLRDIFVSRRFFKLLGPWTEKSSVALLPLPGELPTNTCEATRADSVAADVRRLAHSAKASSKEGSLTCLQPAAIDPARDLAAIMYTSGSTGVPKGVMVSHRNIECNTRDIIFYMGLSSEDRAMVVLPFHYCFGLSLLHSQLMAGGTLVLNNDFRLFPESVLQEMQAKECTGFAGVPSTYQILLRRSRFRSLKFPKLRWFQQAGGKLPNPYIQEIHDSFPSVRFFTMYGQTEATARLSYLPPDRLQDKFGSVGKGLPSTKLEVLDKDGVPVLPGSEEVGEIVANGENVTLGYWNDPEETRRYFIDRKLRTGDLARVDKDGFIYIVERERELIKSGGNRVSAKEVEGVIAELPEVVEVAVVGTPHELLGEAIQAFLTTVHGAHLSTRDVEKHCRKRLPAYKTPEEIVILPRMPHNSAGKILKQELKKMFLIPGQRRQSQTGLASDPEMPGSLECASLSSKTTTPSVARV